MTNFNDYDFERFNVANKQHVRLGDELEAMRSAENPVMLPIGAEVMAKHTIGIIVSREGVAVGYNGIIFEYENGIGEMGGLFVNQAFRGRGLVRPIKAELFNEVKKIDRIKRVITFANDNSLQLNLDLGFKHATHADVPSQSLANCAGCPMFSQIRCAGQICCDTILVLDTKDLPEIPRPDKISEVR